MKKFVLLYIGTRRKPTPEAMEKIKKWFEVLGDRIVDSGNPLATGYEIEQSETAALQQDNEDVIGYSIISAESVEEIEKLSKDCPTKIRAYEALPM